MERRMAKWVAPGLRYRPECSAEYALSVSSAAFGAVTTPGRIGSGAEADRISVSDLAAAGARGR